MVSECEILPEKLKLSLTLRFPFARDLRFASHRKKF
jgi:hypothetical protein